MEKDYCSIVDAARELNIPPRRISDARYRGTLPESMFVKFGSRRILRRSDLPVIREKLAPAQKVVG